MSGAGKVEVEVDPELTILSCADCGNVWLPAGHFCPRCLGDAVERRAASGKGRLYSWVVYHHVYDEAFAGRVPYNVALVELEEGPRVVTTVIDVAGGEGLEVDLPVTLAADEGLGAIVARAGVSR